MASDQAFPLPVEDFVASTFEILKERGAAREIALLFEADVGAFQASYDNWNGGTYGWGLRLSLPLPLFSRLSSEDRDQAAKIILDAGSVFFLDFENDTFDKVQIAPKPARNPNWRDDAAAYLGGAGINNQGRVRSDNIASRNVDGLLFRSEPEIHLYRALKQAGVTFAPLPVFVRGGPTYARLEPDFVILKDGVVMVVEVDGDTYHRESPVEAHQRLVPLDHEGAKIERVRASDCDTAERAVECAKKIVQILDKRIAQLGR